jgi:hypothetical protein
MNSLIAACRAAVTALALTALVGLAGGGSLASKQIDPPGTVTKSIVQLTWDAQDRTPPGLDTVIERFEVSDETVPAAVVRLVNEHGVLVGLYVVPWPETPAPEPLLGAEKPLATVSATFENATVAQILNGLVTLDPRFIWWEDRGVINVALASTVEDSTHPLNTPLPLFEVDEVPYLLALAGDPEWRDRLVPGPLLEEVYLVTGLLVGFQYFGPPPDLYPPVTISVKGWTTVEILNETARQLKLPWYIVDRRLLGGSILRFWMGVKLVRLPRGTPVAAAPPKAGTQQAAQEKPCPCSAPSTQATVPPKSAGQEAASASGALVPLRQTLAAAGFDVVWDPANRQAIAERGSTCLSVTADSRYAYLNNVLLTLPRQSAVIDDKLQVPELLIKLTLAAASRKSVAEGAGETGRPAAPS